MKILVTGATGFIGSRLVRRLCADGHDVSIYKRNTSENQDIKDLGIQYFTGDITDLQSFTSALESVDVVFHNAALVAQWRGYRELLFNINILGTRNVIEAVLKKKVKRLIVVSSSSTIGATKQPEIIDETFLFNLPHMVYANSKWQAEQEVVKACGEQGLDAVVVNPATVFGAGDKNCNAGRTVINAKKGIFFGYPPGGTTVIDIEDVVSGMIAAMQNGRTGERYILGNEHLSFKALLSDVAAVVNIASPKVRISSMLLCTIAMLKEFQSCLTRKEPYPSSAAAEMSTKFMYFSNAKALRELGWKPSVDFKKSLLNTYHWYLERGFIDQ